MMHIQGKKVVVACATCVIMPTNRIIYIYIYYIVSLFIDTDVFFFWKL